MVEEEGPLCSHAKPMYKQSEKKEKKGKNVTYS